jgi:DNA-binding CsgD family transcriptional regulator
VDIPPRQLEAFATYLTRGSQKETAAAMGIRPNTVRQHLNRMYARIGVHDTFGAATKLGWLVVPDHLRPIDRTSETSRYAMTPVDGR